MLSLPFADAISKLPVAELQATLEDFVQPVSEVLPDIRLQRLVPLAVRGIVSSESPLITQMAQGVSRTEGTVWAVDKRFYRFLSNPRFTTDEFTAGLYQRAQATVRDEAPDYVVVALDPVNFEKPYTRDLEGVSIVRKSTPPGSGGAGAVDVGVSGGDRDGGQYPGPGGDLCPLVFLHYGGLPERKSGVETGH